MLVLGVGVEHVQQGLLAKVCHLLLYRLRVAHSVALGQVELGKGWLGRRMINEGEALLGKWPVLRISR